MVVRFFTLGHDWLYRVHGKMFKISPETFDSIYYFGMVLFKLGILLLNVSPYLALLIIRSR